MEAWGNVYIDQHGMEEVVVTLQCNHCDTQYEIEMGDLLQLVSHGCITCECGEEIKPPSDIYHCWEV